MKAKIMFSVFLLMFSIFTAGAIAGGTEGTNNNFFGTGAGASITSGTNESFFGGNAGNATSSGSHNTFMGYNTGTLNTTGDSNTFLGMNAGYYNTAGYENTFVGRAAGFNNTSSYNSFFGFKAGYSNTSAGLNTFIGSLAGYANTSGSWNTFTGRGSGEANTTGTDNTFMGWRAGYLNTTGQRNIFLGSAAGMSNTVENNNITIGAWADIDGSSDTVTNATAIGYRAYVSQPNSLVLGSINGVNDASSSVNVGIGTSAPVRQLHIVGDQAVFRMDRPYDTAAFMLVRTDGSGSPLKTFVVGTNASASNTGEFVINDLGTDVGGPGNRRMTISNSGNVTFTGNVYANAFAPSSMEYKDNIRTYENALDTVRKLRGVKFDWKDSGKPSVGLIAEEVEKVVPEIVAHNEGNTSGVNYASLVGVLVEAVKEQQGLIQEQQKIIAGHSEEIAELKRLLILSNAVSKAD